MTGRVKEMIKVSGFNVFLEEVKAIRMLHPDVQQVAVIGVTDVDKGEVINAFACLATACSTRKRC